MHHGGHFAGCMHIWPSSTSNHGGTTKDAVQTSLELSEPVDLKTLPGLDDLWLKHDLNTEGDAAHFVNSLWLRSQTRVMQYRYSEIKEGGYLVKHVQLPLVVDYPDELLDEITWQELLNGWANQGLGQFLGDDKMVLVGHVNRATTHEGVIANPPPGCTVASIKPGSSPVVESWWCLGRSHLF